MILFDSYIEGSFYFDMGGKLFDVMTYLKLKSFFSNFERGCHLPILPIILKLTYGKPYFYGGLRFYNLSLFKFLSIF